MTPVAPNYGGGASVSASPTPRSLDLDAPARHRGMKRAGVLFDLGPGEARQLLERQRSAGTVHVTSRFEAVDGERRNLTVELDLDEARGLRHHDQTLNAEHPEPIAGSLVLDLDRSGVPAIHHRLRLA